MEKPEVVRDVRGAYFCLNSIDFFFWLMLLLISFSVLSAFLDDKDKSYSFSHSHIVQTLKRNLNNSVTCKIRYMDSESDSIELARRCAARFVLIPDIKSLDSCFSRNKKYLMYIDNVASGAEAVGVHARHRHEMNATVMGDLLLFENINYIRNAYLRSIFKSSLFGNYESASHV